MPSPWSEPETWFSAVVAAATVASVLIYRRMLQLQKAIREAQRDVDLRVDVDFLEGETKGVPDVWIENAGEGRGFIESVQLIIFGASRDKSWTHDFYVTGKRKLGEFSTVHFSTLPALQRVAKKL